jgi:glycerophosphoryl diester phosphodiesterase
MHAARLSTWCRVVASLVGTSLVVVALVLTSPGRASASTSCLDAAHRGGGSTATENSLGALTSALAAGADYLEMDVQVTSDGTFVLMHDETIRRTTNGRGRIRNKTWQRLSRVRLDDGTPVPTLQQVLDLARPTTSGLLLELKWVPSSRFASLAAMLDDFGASRVVVNSFSTNVVSTFHARYPAVPTALDVSRRITVRQAASYGGVMPDHRHVTLHWLARLRAAGVATYLWTVDKPTDWARYSGRVTLLLTNHPADYTEWRSTHCA